MSVNFYDKDTDTLTQVAGNATVPIDDTTPSTDKVYSSSKIETDYMKNYTNLEDIGITGKISSVSAIFNAMPDNSRVVVECGHVADGSVSGGYDITDIPMYNKPSMYGVLEIVKINSGRHSIKFSPSLAGATTPYKTAFGRIKGTDGSGLLWDIVATEEKTTITDYTVNSTYATDNYHEYYVENGTVHLRGMIKTKAIIPANTIVTLITVGKTYAPKGGGGFQFASDSFAKIYSMSTKNTDGYGVCWVYSDINIPVNSYCTYEASWRID